MKIDFTTGPLDEGKQRQLSAGFESHSETQLAPPYQKERFNWTVEDEHGNLIAALTANLLWDWLYIDELWVDEACRGSGMGKKLMAQAEEYAKQHSLSGLWLWTQSWQAPQFYQSLGFEEFTRFDDFPAGHSRIGLRKPLAKRS
ncbi:GNAT family N-acetyltransferase [Vibrio vulnificus]|uniref:GNAT family N-acetyltransferase n=2 Tax=Vibrio vulnificus TaxID=672 RepID=UPI000503B462|nr:GNAT family N-acetyltransferase [Vibrio vulnificus]ASJ41083.1 histone acetyltransferase [Vibrio vulnificus]EGR0350355.1 GNAT family N-acetyltransferase [Vibrio vulnificus]EGR0638399.1 GNAT family N-acetyltransferase [Vibrio vulnificus]EGR0647586.1 GNAT family N-acetyltransferase [Vibrio vulnificus]EGR0669377.1 GNAT family N-acetyltransferase [Vibrio vulnificus]